MDYYIFEAWYTIFDYESKNKNKTKKKKKEILLFVLEGKKHVHENAGSQYQ